MKVYTMTKYNADRSRTLSVGLTPANVSNNYVSRNEIYYTNAVLLLVRYLTNALLLLLSYYHLLHYF